MLSTLGSFLLLSLGAAIVTWPLWRLATLHPRLYAALVGLSLLVLIGAALVRRAARARRRRRKPAAGAGGKAGTIALVVALIFLAPRLQAEAASPGPGYPRLGSLGPDDLIFRQQQEEVAAAYAAESAGGLRAGGPGGAGSQGGTAPALIIYSYTPQRDVELLTLAARLNLPYESLATLNRLDRIRGFLAGEAVLVPSLPGVFVPEEPGSDLEYLISYRDPAGAERIAPGPGGRAAGFRFWRGTRFTPEERSLFLGFLFRFPLPAARLTSGFGLRPSPITGKLAEHRGIDLAAPAGTEVYAAREGKVVEAGRDATLGEYLVLEHEGGWRTVYGHLSRREALLNARVDSGMMIGRVGSTGLYTGPHLHFEVRMNGEPRNPESLLPKKATR